jgi:hypothetical protein
VIGLIDGLKNSNCIVSFVFEKRKKYRFSVELRQRKFLIDAA